MSSKDDWIGWALAGVAAGLTFGAMAKTHDDNRTGLQSPWTTGHAATATSVNQAGTDESIKSFFDPNDVDHKVIFAPTRTGMSAGMILPQVLDQADEPKR